MLRGACNSLLPGLAGLSHISSLLTGCWTSQGNLRLPRKADWLLLGGVICMFAVER